MKNKLRIPLLAIAFILALVVTSSGTSFVLATTERHSAGAAIATDTNSGHLRIYQRAEWGGHRHPPGGLDAQRHQHGYRRGHHSGDREQRQCLRYGDGGLFPHTQIRWFYGYCRWRRGHFGYQPGAQHHQHRLRRPLLPERDDHGARGDLRSEKSNQ